MTDAGRKPLEIALMVLRGIVAVVLGEVTMVVLITLVQETLFGGVSFSGSSLPVLLASGILTFLSAYLGGAVAGWIARGFPMVAGIIMAIEIPVETTWLITSGRLSGPLWFDIMAAGSLVVGILLGARYQVGRRAGSGAAPLARVAG